MRKMTTMAATAALAVALSAGAAFAAVRTARTPRRSCAAPPKRTHDPRLRGRDLLYGYGGADFLYGGNEAGWGDKILGGSGGDRVYGQDGHDALYGEMGDDRIYGGHRNDLVSGGSGKDFLDGGPGADKINARDGQKDTIVIRFGEGDVVYYDRGLDVLVVPVEGRKTTTEEGNRLSAAEAAEKKVELSAERPPQGLFEPHGKVLVEHEGEEVLVSEQALDSHLGHGDEIIDPTGRAAEEGR